MGKKVVVREIVTDNEEAVTDEEDGEEVEK